MSDVNTLIDTGPDGFIYDELQTISTGVGKSRVEQIIIDTWTVNFSVLLASKGIHVLYFPKNSNKKTNSFVIKYYYAELSLLIFFIYFIY